MLLGRIQSADFGLESLNQSGLLGRTAFSHMNKLTYSDEQGKPSCASQSVSDTWLAGTQEKVFSVVAPILWNFLPRESRLLAFCRDVNTAILVGWRFHSTSFSPVLVVVFC